MTESGQLQPEETLDDRGVDDVLDEGYSPPERPRGVTAKGVTPREEIEGETLDERIAQEEPDPNAQIAYGEEPPADEELADPSDVMSGESRSGRLVAPDQGEREDTEKELVGEDVGIDGAGASAEEAAMHELNEDDLDNGDGDERE
ncbi:DUF5709 domain-containing protein [Nocardioides daejeonensis]|uniref:DUF5709 domain-containing protein n=1 Tax=Nocardioides daejeonensis TaxID=1046556 RepID=UPI000D74CC73|nr:DUF5709 domain-containing protein [Nocardioides daejeonensis]